MSASEYEARHGLHIPESLRRQVETASIATASQVAQIVDGEQRPAVIAIDGDELVLVTQESTHRWPAAELDRVESAQIVPLVGHPVPIAGWLEPAQRSAFLRAGRVLVGQYVLPEHASQSQTSQEPVDTSGLAGVAGGLCGIIGVLALVSLVSYVNRWDRENVIGHCAVIAAILALPLLILSIALARIESKWRWVGAVGVVVGSLATLVLAVVVVVAVALGSCDGCF